MGCDLFSPASSAAAASLLLHLPLPLLEAILSTLPLRSVLALSSSSKNLHSLVSSLPFRLLHSLSPPNSSPWFFLFGLNHLLPLKNQSFAFDPSLRTWIRLPFLPPPPHNSSSLSGMNGTLFALAGAKQARLSVASSPLKQNWQEIHASMAVGRRDPMVGRFCDDSGCGLGGGSIIIAGGVADDAEGTNELAVEVYDMEKEEWKAHEAMPDVLRGKGLWSAKVGARFYVGDCDGGTVCWLERGKEKWEQAEVEKPKGVIRWQWVGSEHAGLLAVALCAAGGGVKIYKMEEGGDNMKEVAEMPAELFKLFEEEDEKQVPVRSCGGGSNLVYVYSDSRFKEYAACVCELGERGSRWYKMPPLPGPQHRFDRVICVSGPVSLSSCISQSSS